MPAFSRASSSRLGNTAANPHWWLPKLIAPTVFGRGLLAVEIGINTVPSHVRPTLLHGGVSARRLYRLAGVMLSALLSTLILVDHMTAGAA
jgi:hypothetical protein